MRVLTGYAALVFGRLAYRNFTQYRQTRTLPVQQESGPDGPDAGPGEIPFEEYVWILIYRHESVVGHIVRRR
jgi:hypothetical protein